MGPRPLYHFIGKLPIKLKNGPGPDYNLTAILLQLQLLFP